MRNYPTNAVTSALPASMVMVSESHPCTSLANASSIWAFHLAAISSMVICRAG